METNREKAARLKEDGNHHFQAQDYSAADSLYSKAIVADDANPTLYTNRAMARIRLGYHELAVYDCEESLKRNPSNNLKAHFILSQAQLSIGDFEAALESALEAHRLAIETNDKSLGPITQQVLRCKKERWEAMEKKRIRENQDLEITLVSLLERERNRDLDMCTDDTERAQIAEEWDHKIETTRATFEKARDPSDQKRTVPEWAIDDISFAFMLDPVMTKSGKSYERASIMEHLKRYQNDPITRQPLQPSELRPNLQLKEACREFLDANGWAVDW